MRQQQNIKQKQQLNQRQHQSLKLLSLSARDLESYLDRLYDDNPLLEREEQPLAGVALSFRDPEAPDPLETMAADREDPLADVYLQLSMLDLPERQKKIGEYLTAFLDEKGYLEPGWESAAEEFDYPPLALEELVEMLQDRMEPPGLFSRDLQECLLIQARRSVPKDPLLEEVLLEHLYDLTDPDPETLAETLHVSRSEVENVLTRIRSLQPSPLGGSSSATTVVYRVPEVEFLRNGDYLEIRLLTSRNRYSLNPYSKDVVKSKQFSADEHRALQGYYREARDILYALEQRDRTLLRVAEKMANVQRDHLLDGAPLSGLSESDVAAALKLSISTVSRTLQDKYYLFEDNVFRLQDLLSPKLRSGISRDEVRFVMQTMIAGEQKNAPLSDAFISDYFTMNGHPVSRRTVAKYRGELGILPAEKRKIKA